MTDTTITLTHDGKTYTAEDERGGWHPCAGCTFFAGPVKCDLPCAHPDKSVCSREDIIWIEQPQQESPLDMPGFKAQDNSAPGFLREAISIMEQRGQQYDTEGGERSFAASAEAFNAITGYELTPSDVALVQVCIKLVRSQSRAEPHRDSLLDAVAYMALHGEERMKEAV